MLESIRARFAEEGCVHPLNALSREAADNYRCRLERDFAQYQADPDFADWTYYKPYLIFDWYYELAIRPEILDKVEQLIGPDILLWGGTAVVKPPRSAGYFTWHQDETYWKLDPQGTTANLWLALDRVNLENGCMSYIPGSQREGQQAHVEQPHPDVLVRRGQRLAGEIDDSRAAPIVLEPGQFSLHSGLVFHSSAANHSDRPRTGVTMVYLPPSTRPSGTETAILVRGRDQSGYYGPERPPLGNVTVENIAEHRRVLVLMTARRVARRL